MQAAVSVKMVAFADLSLTSPGTARPNFVTKRKDDMEQTTDHLKDLYADEAVCFIAERHNVTPRQLVHYFLSTLADAGTGVARHDDIALERNEIEILKGLSGHDGKRHGTPATIIK